uniref:SH3 domain-binding protein 2 n=1 Tax=Leptobrachium leishanense TaxID=445787 RepID=A0A8C5LSI1_9ANUR
MSEEVGTDPEQHHALIELVPVSLCPPQHELGFDDDGLGSMATNIRRSKSLAASFERRTMCRFDIRAMASGEAIWPMPMKAIGAQNLLTMPGGVTISGYLHKRGGKHFQLLKWPLRYVIIHKGCVYYFKSSTSASSQGAFSLNGYNRVMRAAEETTSSNVFPFKMVHISKKHRTWYFSAASEDERKKWMFAIRKEIDRFHEKKEAVTDLSDSDSESGSFYDSVERPVNINYTANPADASAPSYPPPPIPRMPNAGERRTSSEFSSMPKLFVPLLPNKPNLPDLSGKDQVPLKINLSITKPPPPPIPAFPAVRKTGEPPPLPPPIASERRSSTDTPDKDITRLRKESTPIPNHNAVEASFKQPPPPPPPQIPFTTKVSTYSDAKGSRTKSPTQPPSESRVNNFSTDLNNILKKTPPVPTNKPTTIKSTSPNKPSPVPPNKPNNQTMVNKPSKVLCPPSPPVPPNKPRQIGSAEKTSDASPSMEGHSRPSLQKSHIIPKPAPVPLPRSGHVDRPPISPMSRTSPDGQSFKAFVLETPIIPVKPIIKDEKSNSDEDYEKVPLPPAVFVETTESSDIERMFKARGSPENGLFCIRNSSKAGKVLVVWDGDADKVRNYRIFGKDNKVYLEADMMFEDVGSLVEHYYGNKLPSHENLLLKHAYGCPTSSR